MKLISRLQDQRFCAYCKTPRRVYVKKHVDLTNVLGVIVLAAVITQAYWGGADPRGLFVFCLLIMSGEVFVFLRWRASITCRLCGFDPVVYKRSPERAAALVNQFFKAQAENPQFWLSKSPLLEVHRRMRVEERAKQEHADLSARNKSRKVDSTPAVR
jgi:hypothetical protein